MDLIARISELLDERGWSKYQLAKEADLSQSTISSMMKRGNNPTVSTIESCYCYDCYGTGGREGAVTN